MNETLIEASNLSIGYDSVIQQGISFLVYSGEVTMIEGSNGSGKSTLIKTLLGQIPAIQGKVKYHISRDQISYLPQSNHADLSFNYTVLELLNIYDVSLDYTVFFSDEVLNKKITDLSGGELQRVLIVIQIKADTKCLILDEPFNHLDKETIILIRNFLKTLIRKRNIAILLISHIPFDDKDVSVKKVVF